MKKAVCALFCAVIIALGICPAFAEQAQSYQSTDYGFSVEMPVGFTVIDRSSLSKHKTFIEKIGYSVKSFLSKMEEADMVLYAADSDNSHQAQVKVWKSDFSSEVGDLSALSADRLNTALEAMAKSVGGDGGTLIQSQTVQAGGTVFLCYTVRVEQAFCYSEYITVADGKCYALIYYNSSPEFSDAEIGQRDGILSSFKITAAQSGSIWGGYSLSVRIFSAVILLAATVFAVWIISSFIRDIRARRNAPETIPDRIKMKHK